jgi:hypothetical protein
MTTVAKPNETEGAADDWAETLWDRPAPDPVRLARYRLHDIDEPSRYVRRTAHLPSLDSITVENEALWMRMLRRASLGG